MKNESNNESYSEPEFDSLKSLILDMAQERSLDALLKLIVNRLNERDHLALIRIWLVQPGDKCNSCPLIEECPDQSRCLHLVASAGKPFTEDVETWSALDGPFHRIPLGTNLVGHIAVNGEPQFHNIKDNPFWDNHKDFTESEHIKGFVGQPLVYKGEVLGVIALFPRINVSNDGDGSTWLRIIADHIGAAIANARAFDEIQRHSDQIVSLSRFVEENPNPVIRVDRSRKVVYANPPAFSLLKNWGLGVGDKLPDLLNEALSENKYDEIEIENEDRIFSFEIMPVEGEDYLNIYGRDITERKKSQEALAKITFEKERLENELKFAHLVQEGFLPDAPPDIKGYLFAAKTIPARFVGGDFFDFIPLKENKLGILVGDVSGKGVSAALFMARLLSDFRYLAQDFSDPAMLMVEVNKILHDRSRQGMFATAVYLQIDLIENKILSVNAGHHPILTRNKGGEIIEQGKNGGIPLGVLDNSIYEQEEIFVDNGGLVFIYTDGAVEPANKNGEQFGLNRLSQFISASNADPDLIIDQLREKIQTFSAHAPPHDDITFLAFNVDAES
jgi:serine phosphatase RsbU (regulator of sigma subunit)